MNRFVVVVTNNRAHRYRVFDRISKNSYVKTDDFNLAQDLANKYSEQFPAPSLARRFFAFVLRRPIPEPTPDPVDAISDVLTSAHDLPVEPIPEWKQAIKRINDLCEERKRENIVAAIRDRQMKAELAKGGTFVEHDSVN